MRRAAAASLSAHVLVLAAFALWLQAPSKLPDAVDQGVKVELVLLERQGAGTPSRPAPSVPLVPAPNQTAAPSEPTPIVPALPPAEAALPLPPMPPPSPPPPRSPNRSPSAASVSPVEPPAQRPSPGGTNSVSNTIVTGDSVVPARPDASYRNREPVYPPDAARRGERGVVTLLIHVSPAGLASQVDVTQSSGFILLDRAAQDAIETWHFLPAVRDGAPVAATMPLRVRFEFDGQ